MAKTSVRRARTILVAGVVAIALGAGGGAIGAVPPDESHDDELEELAELAFRKWVVSHGTSPIGGTLACAVDSVGTNSVNCYAQTVHGVVAASAPIPTAGTWDFTLLAGSLDGVGEPATGPDPLDTTVPTTSGPEQPPGTSIGEGMHLVNTQVAPGRYQTVATGFCYWERLNATDDELESIITNDISTSGPVIVDIDPNDAAFSSQGCGEWRPYEPPATPATSFGPGTYVVGSDIQPGAYHSDGGPDCFWYRLSGFGGHFSEIINIESMESPGTVDVVPSDVGFKSSQCGTWTLATRARPSQ